mgnify:CR=1 FL=1
MIGNFSEEEEGKEIVRTALKNFTQEEVTAQISKDLINFKEHILEDKGTPINYNWSIVENIYCDIGNSIAQIIEGFLYSCIDFVQSDQNLNLAKGAMIENVEALLERDDKIDIIAKKSDELKAFSNNISSMAENVRKKEAENNKTYIYLIVAVIVIIILLVYLF